MNYLTTTREYRCTEVAGSSVTAVPESGDICQSCNCNHYPSNAVARYDEEGNCEKITTISCDTKWKMRECFKVALCDFLSCMADELCEDGKFRLPPDDDKPGETKDMTDVVLDCLGNALCSLLHCMPNAICGPKQDRECLSPPALECNYAVEERE